mmetsp:Transcript_17217/g.28607  ORF Transcript_17217/g.28607 Transcript_17217/m.28607 type:complete len:81 (+) Transcript_17217:446-688(+)
MYESLRDLRVIFADRNGYSDYVYMIFDNKTLKEMAGKLPNSRAEMLDIWDGPHEVCALWGCLSHPSSELSTLACRSLKRK